MTRYLTHVLSSPVRGLPSEERDRLRRLAVARFVTELGTRSAFVALVLRADDLTSSATAVSLALAITVAADAAVTPLAGIVGDRFDRKTVMIASDLAAALAYLLLAATTDFALLVVVASCAVAAESFYFPAAGAALPNLFGTTHLGIASATVNQARMAGSILGPVVAGAIATLADVRWMFVVNAVSFLLSAYLVLTLTGRFQSAEKQANKAAADSSTPAHRPTNFFSLLVRHPHVSQFMLLWVVVQLGAGMLWVGLPSLADDLGSQTIGYPGMLTIGAVGSLLGAAVASRLFPHHSLRRLLTVALACQTICLLGTAAAPVMVVAVVAIAGFRLSESVSGASAYTSFQESTPDAVRARASAWVDGATIAAFGIGVAAGGPIVDHLGARWCFVLAGAAAAAGLLVATWLTRDQGDTSSSDDTDPRDEADVPTDS